MNRLLMNASRTAVMATLLLVGAVMHSAAVCATPVSLTESSSFAILAGSTVTNTGPSSVFGDLGISPGTALTGFPPGTLSGTQHLGDPTASLAQGDLTVVYNLAAGLTPSALLATELGGTTLSPGVYHSAAGTFGINGDLTLDALGDPNAQFIFQCATTVITAGASRVVLAGGALASNVFWQVGSSATLGIGSTFKGNILALASITVGNGAAVDGRLLARNGAVTLNANVITAPGGSVTAVRPSTWSGVKALYR